MFMPSAERPESRIRVQMVGGVLRVTIRLGLVCVLTVYGAERCLSNKPALKGTILCATPKPVCVAGHLVARLFGGVRRRRPIHFVP